MKLKYPINLHKGITFLVVIILMNVYNNYSIAGYLYLALHGSYGLMWLLKDQLYPDKQWEQSVSIPYAIFVFVVLALYWIAPFVLISQHRTPATEIMALAVAMNAVGVMLHFASDAQKYFTLKYNPGLITEGFFARSRNINYLGEAMIYISFGLLSASWLGMIGIGAFFFGAFVPNMLKKDKSLARYPAFTDYKKRTWLFLPRLIR
jgi:protein-S-isoprenylcysteine O-methyltransferase Ste14